jgi:hypothetical protein
MVHDRMDRGLAVGCDVDLCKGRSVVTDGATDGNKRLVIPVMKCYARIFSPRSPPNRLGVRGDR